MSRQATSKSRAEKGACRSGGGAQTVVAPPVSNDIVPGRLTEADWSKLMLEDENNSFVSSIVEDVLDLALEGCYQSYISGQVLPFIMDQTKDALLQIIEWNFLSRDFGETNIENDASWKEDFEPESGVIDTWAQGAVPVNILHQPIAPSNSLISEAASAVENSQVRDDSLISVTEPAVTISEQPSISDSIEKLAESENQTEQEAVGRTPPRLSVDIGTIPEEDLCQNVYPKITQRKVSYKQYLGRLPPSTTDFDCKPSKQELPKKENKENQLSQAQKSLIRLQEGRPPGNREVTFDEKGNVIGVMKLQVESLPTHRVRVSYNIIDPDAELTAQRLAAIRTGRIHRDKKRSWKSELSAFSDKKSMTSYATQDDARRKSMAAGSHHTKDVPMNVHQFSPGIEHSLKTLKRRGSFVRERRIHGARIDPLPHLLIETIDASPGVIVQEGEQVKKGPERKYSRKASKFFGKAGRPFPGHKSPIARMLGDKFLHSKLRPPFDPNDMVVQEGLPQIEIT